jgi:hypothetical protein
MGDAPDIGDEANLPIIVPPPGQILRRAARTKIRKPSLQGDGGGHRFPASRRGTRGGGTPTSPDMAQRPLSVESSPIDSQHGETVQKRDRTSSGENVEQDGPSKRDTFDESLILDAYARGEDEEDEFQTPAVVMSPHDEMVPLPPPEEEAPQLAPPLIYQPQPQRLSVPGSGHDHRPSPRTPSPDRGSLPIPSMESYTSTSPPQQDSLYFSPTSPQETSFPLVNPQQGLSYLSPSSPPQQRKEKDKKGLFGKWGGDREKKKSLKDKERENRERAEKEKEKESGFFGSLFGGKKKQDESMPTSINSNAGREAAAALLGASKSSKSPMLPSSSPLVGVGGSYARYPLHVERAIYRLSHIKLANPRRPLYEQVLISNLMFWYLGVINKTQNPSPPPTPGTATGSQVEKEQKEREVKEKAEQEQEEQERLEREKSEKDRIAIEQKKETRRGSLTKTPSPGTPGAGRRAAEMPVRGPQYEMQHRVMEQEYSAFSGESLNPGPSSAMGRPAPNIGPQHRMKQGQPLNVDNNYYYSPGGGGVGQQPGYSDHVPQQRTVSPQLPPGAMAPVSVDQQPWFSQSPPSSSPRPRQSLSPPPPGMSGNSPPSAGFSNSRRSRSPPPPNQPLLSQSQREKSPSGGRIPGRSLSATAAPPQVNGRLKKGSASAHAVLPANSGRRRPRTSDGAEEDVPLAVWQQQRRR